MLSPFVSGYLITQVLTKQKMIPSMFQEGINSYISANGSAREFLRFRLCRNSNPTPGFERRNLHI